MTPEQEATLKKMLHDGPTPEYRDSGMERGQDYYTPPETYSHFNERVVRKLREFLT